MKIENYLKEILDLIMIDDTYQYSFDLDEELSYEEEERFSDTSLCSASLEDPYQGVDAVDVCTVRIWKSGLEVATEANAYLIFLLNMTRSPLVKMTERIFH